MKRLCQNLYQLSLHYPHIADTNRHHVQVGWIGDEASDLRLHLYSDADFAGCQTTNRCTSGMFMALEGPHSSFPVAFNCKKQHQTCYATAESESVAGCFALRAAGLPGLVLWDTLIGRAADQQTGARCLGCGAITAPLVPNENSKVSCHAQEE